jgi:hypothetical protein
VDWPRLRSGSRDPATAARATRPTRVRCRLVPSATPQLVRNTGLRSLRAAIAEPHRFACEPKVDGVRGPIVYGPGGTLETRKVKDRSWYEREAWRFGP